MLTTVNPAGIPNAIYATCVSQYGEDQIVVANNFFSKTLENILAGSKASLLFITKEGCVFVSPRSCAFLGQVLSS